MKKTSRKLIYIGIAIVTLIVARITWTIFKPLGDKLSNEQVVAIEHAKAGEVQIIYPDGRKEWVKTPNSEHVVKMIAAEKKKILDMEKQFKNQNSKK